MVSRCFLQRRTRQANPNVAPDAPMNWPSVLIIPFGPAPYLKMVTVPKADVRTVGVGQADGDPMVGSWPPHTVDEADDDADSCSVLSDVLFCQGGRHEQRTAPHHGAHLGCFTLAAL